MPYHSQRGRIIGKRRGCGECRCLQGDVIQLKSRRHLPTRTHATEAPLLSAHTHTKRLHSRYRRWHSGQAQRRGRVFTLSGTLRAGQGQLKAFEAYGRTVGAHVACIQTTHTVPRRTQKKCSHGARAGCCWGRGGRRDGRGKQCERVRCASAACRGRRRQRCSNQLRLSEAAGSAEQATSACTLISRLEPCRRLTNEEGALGAGGNRGVCPNSSELALSLDRHL